MSCILVIDDERSILNMIEHALSVFGFSVETAVNGEEGIEKYNTCDFDLVITDICMPGIDGLAVLQHIRNSGKKSTPTIGISGTPWLLENSDFDVVLPKPFPIKVLFDTVKRVMGQANSRVATA
jgi:CheY-like chemotaxis protein